MEAHSMKGYKVFKVFENRPGQLFPPMVDNPGKASTPVGVWLDAQEGEFATNKDGSPMLNSLGRKMVKNQGSNSNALAYRPGWHLGEMPHAPQFYEIDKATGEKVQHANFVWAECEFTDAISYQSEAEQRGYTKNGKYQHSLAGLDYIPVNGYYKYRTNPNPNTIPWLIAGAMKVNRLLNDAEVNAILSSANIEPMKRAGGDIDLTKYGF
jgi:hypothetical protein